MFLLFQRKQSAAGYGYETGNRIKKLRKHTFSEFEGADRI